MEKEVICPDIKDKHESLVNMLATCLIREPKYYEKADERVEKIEKALEEIANIDPEFILMLAFYLRQELNLRSSSNYILAFAATHAKVSIFFRKYFPECVRLPSDLLEVVEMVQHLKPPAELGKLNVPAALKKGIMDKFSDFSVYQLGKYCSENKRKRDLVKAKERAKKAGEAAKGKGKGKMGETHTHTIEEKKPVNMKRILRICHIQEPKYEVMSILGKRAPETKEDWDKAFPNKVFAGEEAGKRMRIPIPKTWETELSDKGNKAEVWENLVASKQLPYMAMLRNIRNMIVSGVSPEVHNQVCDRIQDPIAVANSRQFPFRFLSAYEVLSCDLADLKARYENPVGYKEKAEKAFKEGVEMAKSNPKKKKKVRKNKKGEVKMPNILIPKHLVTNEILDNYRKALDNAIKIATMKNIPPIRGKTVVFADTSGSMGCKLSGGINMGSIRECIDTGILLGLMTHYASESCRFFCFSSPGITGKCYIEFEEFKSENILENLKHIKQEAASKLGGGTDFPFEFWKNAIEKEEKIDTFIIFSDMMISPGHTEMGQGDNAISSILSRYRKAVNPQMLFISVNLAGYGNNPIEDGLQSELDFSISGYSDAILRFISHRQLSQVEYIKDLATKHFAAKGDKGKGKGKGKGEIQAMVEGDAEDLAMGVKAVSLEEEKKE